MTIAECAARFGLTLTPEQERAIAEFSIWSGVAVETILSTIYEYGPPQPSAAQAVEDLRQAAQEPPAPPLPKPPRPPKQPVPTMAQQLRAARAGRGHRRPGRG